MKPQSLVLVNIIIILINCFYIKLDVAETNWGILFALISHILLWQLHKNVSKKQ